MCAYLQVGTKKKKKRLVKMDLCVKRNYNTLIHHLKKKEKKNMTKTYSMLICPIFLFVLMHHIFGIIIVESIGLRSTGKKKNKQTHG